MSANDRQEAGSHYAGRFQHWDYVLLCLDGRYLEGNITKYVSRHRKKNGAEDLKKALHYLDKLREFRPDPLSDAQRAPNYRMMVEEFCKSQELNDDEAEVMRIMATWMSMGDINDCARIIQHLITDAERADAERQAAKAGVRPLDAPAWPSTCDHIEAGPGYVDQN